jgi:hypothetical protein
MSVTTRRFRIAAVVFLAAATCIWGCRPEGDRSRAQQQHIESMMVMLSQIQKNLSRIRQKEAVVERLSSEIESTQKKSAEQIGRDIYENIRFIDSTITASKSLVGQMEKKNSSSGYRILALDRMVQELKGELDTRDHESRALKSEIQKLSREVSRLHTTVDVLDEFIIDQESRVSTAYYIVGSENDLASKGVLASSNPLARLFGSNIALASDFDIAQFRRIDISETRDLFIDKPLRRLHVVTPHTKGSYDFVGGETSSLLLIKDESEFWKKSRCLVIVVD